jgi:transcriptional regulator with XRE-family HTH domain
MAGREILVRANTNMRTEEFGPYIRSMRQRRRQVHSGEPWTLDDLAAVMGTDKSYLSRVERGQITPGRATLIHMAEALALGPAETSYLLRLAGHSPVFEPPDMSAAREHIRHLMKLSAAYLHPVYLKSSDLRFWYVNSLFLRVMDLTPEAFRHCMQGQFFKEVWRCVTWRKVRQRTQSWEPRQRRAMQRLRMAALDGKIPDEHLATAREAPRWHRFWDYPAAFVPENSLSATETRCQVIHPVVGVLQFDAWWTPVESDPRFEVGQLVPHDVATREVMRALRRLPRPVDLDPCPVHSPSASELPRPRILEPESAAP